MWEELSKSGLTWLLQPTVTLLGVLATTVGISLSVWLSITQSARQKRLDRVEYMKVAVEILEDTWHRIADRLQIRFYPEVYNNTGRKMRQARADAAIVNLGELRFENMPLVYVTAFARARGTLTALNVQMNAEKEWPASGDDLARCATVYTLALEAIDELNAAAARHKARRIRPPDFVLPNRR